MTQLSVYTQDFVNALYVLDSFTSKPKEFTEQPMSCELIFGNITSTGQLILTASTTEQNWGIVLLPLADFEGELTDFAIRAADISAIAGTFGKAKPEDTVALTVEHNEYESKTMLEDKLVTEIKRATRLRFMEEGSLFGSRIAQLAGADGRQYSMAQIWSTLAGAAGQLATLDEFTIEPNDLATLKKATRTYGTLTCHRTPSSIIVRAGNKFIGSASTSWLDDKAEPPIKLGDWLTLLDQEAEHAPEHKIYAESQTA